MFHLISVLLSPRDLLHLSALDRYLGSSLIPFCSAHLFCTVWWSSFPKLSSCEKTKIFFFKKKNQTVKRRNIFLQCLNSSSLRLWFPMLLPRLFTECYHNTFRWCAVRFSFVWKISFPEVKGPCPIFCIENYLILLDSDVLCCHCFIVTITCWAWWKLHLPKRISTSHNFFLHSIDRIFKRQDLYEIFLSFTLLKKMGQG